MGTSTVGIGKTYSLLSTWESTKQADLTGAGPEIADCYGVIDEGTGLTQIFGWTTTAADYILIRTAPSEPQPDGRSREVSGANAHAQIRSGYTSSTSGLLIAAEDYVRLSNIEIYHDGATTGWCFSTAAIGAANSLQLDNCIFWTANGTGALKLGDGDSDGFARNCVFYTQGTYAALVTANTNLFDFEYCTFATSAGAFALYAGTGCSATNCVGVGGLTETFYTSGTTTGSNNASTDTTAQTMFSSSVNSITAANEFNTVAYDNTADFRLKSTAPALTGAGTTIGGITTDIAGNTRDTSTPSIGAWEYSGRISTVGTGKTYSLLSTWESTKQADITGAGAEIADCYGVIDETTTAVTVDGWTTTAADYIEIRTAPSEPHCDGRSRDVSGANAHSQLRCGSTAGPILICNEEFFRVTNFEVYNDAGREGVSFTPASTTNLLIIKESIIHGTDAGSPLYCLAVAANARDFDIQNTIMYCAGARGCNMGSGSTGRFDYVTIYITGGYGGFYRDGNVMTNCYIGGASTACIYDAATYRPSGSNTVVSDASTMTNITSALKSKAVANQFNTVATDSTADFRLKTGADCIVYGTNIGDISTDIAETTRHATTPDCGAFEFVAAPTASTVGTGKTYSLLSTWEAAKQADITGLGPEIADCYGVIDEGTTRLLISGWTTTAADYIHIRTAPSEPQPDGRSRDVSGANAHAQIRSGHAIATRAGPLEIWEEYVRISNIECYNDGATGNAIYYAGTSTCDIRLDNVIAWAAGTGAGFRNSTAGTVGAITNCLFYSTNNPVLDISAAIVFSYCTSYTTGTNNFATGIGCTITNCYAGGGSGYDFWNAGTSTGSNNISADTTAQTQFSGSLNNKAAANQFNTVAVDNTADFRLKAGSDCEAFGTLIGGITTDMPGTTRDVTTPDVGMFELVAAIVPAIYQRRHVGFAHG